MIVRMLDYKRARSYAFMIICLHDCVLA